MSREFGKRGKKVQKMTRDGLVEQNLDTGEEVRVSQRGLDFNLRQEAPPDAAGARSPGAGRSLHRIQAAQPDTAPESERQPEVQRDVPLRRPSAREDTGANAAHRNRAAYREHGQKEPTVSPAPDALRGQDTEAPVQRTADTERHSEYMAEAEHTEGLPVTGGAEQAERPPITEGAEYSVPSHVPRQVDTPLPASPRQRGTDYARRFMPEAQLPPAPAVTQPDSVQRTEVPEVAPDAAIVEPERPGRLLFAEDAGQAAPPDAAQPASSRQRGTEYARRFTPEARASPASGESKAGTQKQPPATGAAATEPPKPSRLQFTPGENTPAPDKKLQQLQGRADAANARLERARDSLPVKNTAKRERVYDEQKGKAKREIRQERRPLAPGEKRRAPLSTMADPAGVGKVGAGMTARTAHQEFHRKIHEVERENVGIETAHRAELAGEAVVRGGACSVRAAYRFHKNAPYRAVEKLEKQARRANSKLSFHKAGGAKGGALSRAAQKRNIKKRYANAYRAAQNAAKRAGSAAKRAGQAAVGAVKNIVTFAVSHPAAAGMIAIILLIVFFFFSLFSSCANTAVGAVSGVVTSSYVAADADIDSAGTVYATWETDLREQIANAETDYGGYDEYRYDVDESAITHDPFALMAYLTARYQDFQYADVEADLRAIFSEQYELTFTPEIETRYHDPGDSDGDGDREPYEWRILNVKLTVTPLSDILAGRMDGTQSESYDVYMDTRGNRQYLISPFPFDWEPYISCLYGWRVHPITGARDNHTGLDIAVAQGTEILAGQDGVVSFSGSNGDYGLMVQIDGENGLSSRYAHCSELLVAVGQEVQKGDVIAKVGSTGASTGPHLHLEVIKDGQRLNPIYFAESR